MERAVYIAVCVHGDRPIHERFGNTGHDLKTDYVGSRRTLGGQVVRTVDGHCHVITIFGIRIKGFHTMSVDRKLKGGYHRPLCSGQWTVKQWKIMDTGKVSYISYWSNLCVENSMVGDDFSKNRNAIMKKKKLKIN